jgi:hypothetical protein
MVHFTFNDEVKKVVAVVIIQKYARKRALRVAKQMVDNYQQKLRDGIAKLVNITKACGTISPGALPLSTNAGEYICTLPVLLEYISNVLDVQKLGRKKALYGICHGVRTAHTSGEAFPLLTHILSLPSTAFSMKIYDAKNNDVMVHVYPTTHLTARHAALLREKIMPPTFASTIPQSSRAFEFFFGKTFIGAAYLQKFGSGTNAITVIDSVVTVCSGKGYGSAILNVIKRMAAANIREGGASYVVAQCVTGGGFWDYRMHATNIARSLILQQAIMDPSAKIYDKCVSRCLVV